VSTLLIIATPDQALTLETIPKKSIDEFALLSYHPRNTGKEVIEKHMSSNHSEVAET